jgi:hypothetical protein
VGFIIFFTYIFSFVLLFSIFVLILFCFGSSLQPQPYSRILRAHQSTHITFNFLICCVIYCYFILTRDQYKTGGRLNSQLDACFCWFLVVFVFDPKHGNDILLRNVGITIQKAVLIIVTAVRISNVIYLLIFVVVLSRVRQSTWDCGQYWPIVPAPDDRRFWLWSN